MANVVKIYEVKSLGYSQLITELKNINAEFEKIKKTKAELNAQKYSTDDVKKISEINSALAQQRIRTRELTLEKQQLINQMKVEDIARKQEEQRIKNGTSAITSEIGSIKDLIAQRKELRTLLESTNPNSGSSILFRGQNLSYQQALNQFQTINGQIKTMQSNIIGASQAGTSLTNALTQGFKNLSGNLGIVIAQWASWFALFNQTTQLIGENFRLSDAFADLQIRIHGTREEVEQLVEELKQIETRTSLIDLVDIANIISKKGVAKEEVAALTAEFDKLNVVLGKEIGDPQTAVASIIKLISIFNEDRNVTPKRVQELGTALFKLTTSGVATGDFLIGFAERVGAVRGITGLTIGPILGLGAALQQLGQHEEVAGTAAIQLSTKLFSDVPKFAAAARLSVEEFRKLLDENPFEALVTVAETLKNLKEDELAAEFEEVVLAFQDVNITGARIKAVLGDIATNADFVRDRMNKARVSMKDLEDQSTALELKQNTLAATFQKVRKEFELAFTSKAVQTTLAIIGGLILIIVQNLGLIIPLLGIYAGAWAIANANIIAAKVETIALNVAMTFQRAILAITTTFTQAYTIALGGLTGATASATAATNLWGIAMRLLPIGLLLTFLALLFAACQRVVSGFNGTTEALRKQALQMQINNEITIEANKAISDQVVRLESLVKVVTSTAVSYDVQRQALEDLIAVDARFAQALTNRRDQFGNLIIDMNKVIEISKLYRDEIELNAKATAAQGLASEKYKEYLDVVALRQKIEREAVIKGIDITKTGSAIDLFRTGDTKFEKDKRFAKGEEEKALQLANEQAGKKISTVKALIDNLIKAEKTKFGVYEAYVTESSKLDADLKAQNDRLNADKEKAEVITLESRIAEARRTEQSENELETLLKAINIQLGKLKEGSPKLLELQKARDEFKERLDKLKGVNQSKYPYRGAQIGGENKDALSLIDEARDLELAEAELRQVDRQKDHKLTLDEEVNFVNEILGINQKYLNQKIEYLENQESLNAKEKATLAAFKKDLYDLELASNLRIQTLKDQQFNFERRQLEQALRNQIAEINLRQRGVEIDPTKTFTERAQAKLDADNAILKLQEQFNNDIDILEKKYNQKSTENAQRGADDVQKTQEQILKDRIDLFNAGLKDIQEASAKIEAEIRSEAARQAIVALTSGDSDRAIARRLEEIRNKASIDVLTNETARLKIELELYEQGLNSKIKSEREYLEAKARLKEAEKRLIEETNNAELNSIQKFVKALKNFADDLITGVLGIKRYTKDLQGEAEKQADALALSISAINRAVDEAVEGFFDKQKQAVDNQLEIQQQRLNDEEERVKARAQSQAEIDAIDKQYDKKRQDLEKKAAEEKKKIALKELAINYAVSVVKALANFGLPLALIPIAAQTLLYAVQRANIQNQQFAKGGIPKSGGQIQGPSHSQGGVKFHPMEAEGRELIIINKNSSDDNTVRTITGTNKQIASLINSIGGGINFSPGASFTHKFAEGGLLGNNYSAPFFSPSSGNNIGSQELLLEIRRLAEEQSKRIDRLQVYQTTKSVDDALRKHVRQNSIGQLA